MSPVITNDNASITHHAQNGRRGAKNAAVVTITTLQLMRITAISAIATTIAEILPNVPIVILLSPTACAEVDFGALHPDAAIIGNRRILPLSWLSQTR